jgi:hypothetical protein
LPGFAQMTYQLPHIHGIGGDRDGRLFAGLGDDPQCAILGKPFTCGDEIRQSLREFRNQYLPRADRQVFNGKERFTDVGEMTVALSDAIDGKRGDVGIGIFDQFQASLGGTDFRDLAMTGSGHINEIGIDEVRRTLQDRHRDKGLIGGKPMHHGGRRSLTLCQSLRQGAAHQRRRIVEQHEHGAFCGGAVIQRKRREKVGPRQCGGAIGPLAGRRYTQPLQELANDHEFTYTPYETSPSSRRRRDAPAKPS